MKHSLEEPAIGRGGSRQFERALRQSLVALANDENLRKQMGGNGREKVRITFDWKVIISQYQALWSELAKLRHNPGFESFYFGF